MAFRTQGFTVNACYWKKDETTSSLQPTTSANLNEAQLEILNEKDSGMPEIGFVITSLTTGKCFDVWKPLNLQFLSV